MLEAAPHPDPTPPRLPPALPLSNACSSPRLGMKLNQKQTQGKRRKKKNPNRPEWRGKEKKKNRKKKRNEKKSLCKKKIKICRLSFITITFFFCTEKHLMGGRAARPGLCAGGQGKGPPPAAAPLPAPRRTPGKAHPDGFLLPMAGESQQRDARGPLCSVAWACCCCGFELPSLRVSSCLEKGQDVMAGCRG